MFLWNFIALNIFRLASLAEGEISVQQRPLWTLENKNGTVFCNYTSNRKESTDFKATLLKGVAKEEVSSISWGTTSNTSQCNSSFTCDVKISEKEKEVTFSLLNLQTNQTDFYFCKIEIRTPPYESNVSLCGSLLQGKEPECQQRQESIGMTVAAGALAFYSVLITLVLCYCWVKMKKKKVIHKDYFNMTPWQSNGPKRKPNQSGVPARNYTAYRSWEP